MMYNKTVWENKSQSILTFDLKSSAKWNTSVCSGSLLLQLSF